MGAHDGDRRSVTVQLPRDLVVWLRHESDRRVVSRNLLVEEAVRLLAEAVAYAPDLVRLPPPPRP